MSARAFLITLSEAFAPAFLALNPGIHVDSIDSQIDCIWFE